MKKNAKGGFFADVFYGVRKKVLLCFYVFSIVMLGVLSVIVIGDIPGSSLRIQVLVGFLFTIAGVVAGASLSVILDLPTINYEFDKIKNDIALKKIDSPDGFARRLAALLIDYFTFSFFRIKYACVQIIDTERVYSDQGIPDAIEESEFQSMQARSRMTEEIFYEGGKIINDESCHLYVIPVWFGDEWLGFIGIFTEKKLLRLYVSFLADFEDHCVDDQLVHVLHIKRQKIMNRFYCDVNAYSINITRKMYATIREYQMEILRYLVTVTRCAGGLCATIYDEECVTFFSDETFDDTDIREYYRQYYRDNTVSQEPRITVSPDTVMKHVFDLPLAIETPIGIVHLFDTTEDKFRYFYTMLVNAGKIRLNYDLKNLALFLDVSPQERAFLRSS